VFKTDQNTRNLRSALLLGATSAAALGASAPAVAQQAGGNVETVVVTGSRIPQAGIYSASPVTAVGQQEMKFEGTTDVNTLINNLPEAFSDQNATVTNGGSGTANADLRGLGAKRTLVLVNGTRLMPGDPLDPVPDLNDVPVALVDHVEVLTGGASAVYGSDALAGVVNFIMRKDFEGIEVDGQYTINEADNTNPLERSIQAQAGDQQAPENVWDGSTSEATLILGSNSPNGKGNVTAYVGYRNTQAVLSGARDYAACSTKTTFLAMACFGSSNRSRFIDLDTGADLFLNGTGKPGSGFFTPFTGAANQVFNFGPIQYLQRPDTRYIGGFFAHYQENKELDVYSSFMFTDDHTVEQLGPSGLFLGSGVVSGAADEINCSNPLMSAQENKTLCGTLPGDKVDTAKNGFKYFGGEGNSVPGQSLDFIGRRDVEAGPRVTDLRHTAYRMNVGARGDLGDGWSYDVYGQYGISLLTNTTFGNISKSRVQNALQVDPLTGNCYAAELNAQGIATDPACQPLDIFTGFGGISKAGNNYVSATGFQNGFTQEQIVSGSLTGDLGEWGIQSPWAKNPVAVSLGSEWRSEAVELNVSREFFTNDLDGGGGATLPVPESGFNVSEGFTEVKVPVIQGIPWFEDVTINGGYRYSSYSTAGGVSAYKDGIEWQPIDDIRFRASFERAVRAPNVLELFLPLNVVLFSGQDPCSTSTAGQCAFVKNAGNSTLLGCISSQCDAQVGGNVNLKPETANTKTLGLVFTPTFLDGFTATVDYFDIKVDKFVSEVSPSVTLAECYGPAATAATEAFFCPLVQRNAIGEIFAGGFVSAQTVNTGFLHTRGVDFEANYTTDMTSWGMANAGSLDFNFVGTWVNSLVTEPLPGLQTYDCNGLFGVVCGSPTPTWRHKFRVTWTSPWDVDLSLAWRHFSGVDFDANTDNSLLNGGACGGPCDDLPDNHIPAYDYFDLSGDWQVREGVDLRAGVNNILDKNPPLLDTNILGASSLAGFGNGNTYPGVYDALGRAIFVGATIKY
jgi:outer membrane receptor protein involved in Fe transport